MGIKDQIVRMFSRAGEDRGYTLEYTDYGLRFYSDRHSENSRGKGSLKLQWQYVTLKMLCEQELAKEVKNGFYIPDGLASVLGEGERAVLDLPGPWPGAFELVVKGQSYSPSFSMDLALIRSGIRKTRRYTLEGPFLIVEEGDRYLLDEAQYQALYAIKKHSLLAAGEKTELENLLAVKALQQAKQKGVRMDMRHFDTFEVLEPQQVSVSVSEKADGSLNLIPDFGLQDDPLEIEKRLQELDGKGSAVLRIGKRLVLLDEKRMAAVGEILATRHISARERTQFFKTPSAFLDASLVDLDQGFSIRVHGAEVFKKAYLDGGRDEAQCWFGEEEEYVCTLEAAISLIRNRDDLETLKKSVEEARSCGETSLDFKKRTLLLPVSREEDIRIFEDWDQKVSDFPEDEKHGLREEGIPSLPAEPSSLICVKIDLDEEYVPENLQARSLDFVPYKGRICGDGCHLSPFPYQEEGIRWLVGLGLKNFGTSGQKGFSGALLADDMGLGKTFMTLAALQVFLDCMAMRGKLVKPVLVVAPVALLENWREEVEKAFGDLLFENIVVLQSHADLPRFRQDGAGRETRQENTQDLNESTIRYALKVGSSFGISRLDMPERLVLTNYDTLRDYQFSLCCVDWGMVILDEAQEIKNPNAMKTRAAKGLKADFRLAVTGTPVENSLVDFWCILDTVSPGLLGAYRDFQKTYISPVNKADFDKKQAIRLALGKKLRSHVGEWMLRRTKEDSLSGLPEKHIHDGTQDSRYRGMMTGRQKERYDAVIQSVMAAKSTGESRKVVLPALRRLRDVSLHPDLLDGGAPPVPSGRDETRKVLERSEKLVILLRILEEIRERDEKAIVFVINKKLQCFLSVCLQEIYGFKVDIINGETKSVASPSGRGGETRMGIIRRFEKQPGFGIILMSPLAAGVGLTVVGANNVIHLERHWNPAREAQATDRVYRIGQKRDVHVYIPILTHPELKSFDRNLQELLGRKVDIKDSVVVSSDLGSDDFDAGLFGKGEHLGDGRVGREWLQSMDWQHFEWLIAELAEKVLGGRSWLTPVTGDFGADVVVFSEKGNALIQCKTSIYDLEDAKMVLEPYAARPEYESRFHKEFSRLIFCTNTLHVGNRVKEKAKKFGVEIWTAKEIGKFLDSFVIHYCDVLRRESEKPLSLDVQ